MKNYQEQFLDFLAHSDIRGSFFSLPGSKNTGAPSDPISFYIFMWLKKIVDTIKLDEVAFQNRSAMLGLTRLIPFLSY